MVGGDVGFGIPVGDFSNGHKIGFGLNGVFTYAMKKNLFITGTLGYWDFGMKGSSLQAGGSCSIVPINAGIQYRFISTSTTTFIGVETFLYSVSSSVNVSFLGTVSGGGTYFGFTPLVGIALPVSKNLEFRGQAKYVMILSSSSFSFLNLVGGIHYLLEF